jgi:hypothetical protein
MGRYSRHQPKLHEKPSTFVKRIVKEQAARQAAGQPHPVEAREPLVAAGSDCPHCRGRRSCSECGNRA